eukprot:SAG31_NODE_2582_length_5436_cov_1.573356_1_plen_96_part_00
MYSCVHRLGARAWRVRGARVLAIHTEPCACVHGHTYLVRYLIVRTYYAMYIAVVQLCIHEPLRVLNLNLNYTCIRIVPIRIGTRSFSRGREKLPI